MLRPDLGDRIYAGALELDDVRGAVFRAFWARLKGSASGSSDPRRFVLVQDGVPVRVGVRSARP